MPGVLVVDDDVPLATWACRVLTAQGYRCEAAHSAEAATAALAGHDFEVALLDVHLDGESGIDVLAQMRVQHPTVAAVMVTGEDDVTLAMRAIELGAYGYLVKPVRAGELVINVANALHRRRTEAETRRRLERLAGNGNGHDTAGDLRRALAETGLSADVAAAFQSDTIRRLVRLAEFRDEDTGHHLQRMSRYCEVIGLQVGLPEERCELLRLASVPHDIGKVAIPDMILLKPGKLTKAEFEVMKTHAEIGYELLADNDAELLRLAATIALSHHERWDGSGYPQGIAGEAIPLEGRIAAVADVLDALTSDRVYRPAFPLGMAVEMMTAERGTHFDPTLFDAMLGAFDRIEDIRRRAGD